MTLSDALYLDLLTVAVCASLLLARGGLRHSHPAVIYLCFHVLVFTLRGFGLLHGAIPYLANVPSLEQLRPGEVARALNYADMFLAAATMAWLSAPRERLMKGASSRHRQIPGEHLAWMAILCVPVGLLTLLKYGYIPGSLGGPTVADTSYKTLAQTWPAIAFSALIYRYGFRWFYTVPLIGYFSLIALQGQGRFRLVIPVILLFMIYLDRRRLRMPPLRIIVGIFALFLIFFPMKQIGVGYQQGQSAAQIAHATVDSARDTMMGKDKGQVFLDEFAMVLTQSDRYGHPMWGKPYLSLITLPIPRPVWPGKPPINEAIQKLSSPTRPFNLTGAITTLPGELYVNFGIAGVLSGAFLLARLAARLYRWGYRHGIGSLQHLSYLVFAASMVEILRDGLASVVTFVLIKNIPLWIVLGLVYVRSSRNGGGRHNGSRTLRTPSRNTSTG